MILRAQWGALPPLGSYLTLSDHKGWAVHWEGPRMGITNHSECGEKVRGIQRYHINTQRWVDIAYNFVVCPHGAVYEGRGYGKRSAANGTNEANASYLAVCYLGGEGDPFTSLAQTALRGLLAGATAHPHSYFFSTQCPGNEIREWLRAYNVAPKIEVKRVASAAVPEEDEEMANDAARTIRWPEGVLVVKPDGGTEHYGVPFYGNIFTLKDVEKLSFEHAAAGRAVDPNDMSKGYIIYAQNGDAYGFTPEQASIWKKAGRL